jgi:hypothetical protein
MNTNKILQSFKRFIAAMALSCFLLIGAAGPQPKSNLAASTQNQESIAYVQYTTGKISRGTFDSGGGVFTNFGNFWSG